MAVPNGVGGVSIVGVASPGGQASNNIIRGNLISGNDNAGIIMGDAADTQIRNNRIGTNRVGGSLANNGSGISMSNAGNPRTRIEDNIIAFNSGDGVLDSPDYRFAVAFTADGHQGNAIRRNSIHSNGGLGIDLKPAPLGSEPASTVTPNDPGDGDEGANRLQNFPVLTSATPATTSVIIQGALNSTPNTTYTLDFFANTTADPSGYGEGERYLGSLTVTTNADGDASFMVTFGTAAPLGQFITATATDPEGNTSEFSEARAVSVPVSTVAAVAINDASAQRSMVNSVTVAFSGEVTLAEGAFEVRNADGDLASFDLTTVLVEGNTHAVLVFTGDGLLGGSLADGNYTLIIRADGVTDALGRQLDGDGDGVAGGDHVVAFHRLFGDTDGDRDVDLDDLDAFFTTYGRSSGDEGYLRYLDYNGDGVVDFSDYFDGFRGRFGSTLAAP